MGSLGSSRWHGHSKATTVEECTKLGIGDVILETGHRGTLTWTRGERKIASIGYGIESRGSGLSLVLRYRWGDREDIDLPIRLESSPMRFGGERWWMRCPLARREVPCGRRVAKVYLAPFSKYFGCRTCHRLTYRSVQEHDKRVDALRRNPDLMRRMLDTKADTSIVDLILAMKAFR